MPKKKRKHFIINAYDFHDLNGFYDEIERQFTKDLGFRTGRNLDALNDLLGGGFGVFDEGEPIRLTWLHILKSEKDLGFENITAILDIIYAQKHIKFAASF